MTPQNTLKEIDFQGSIIFLGSGFSRAAENLNNEKFPTGHGLKTSFSKILDVSENDYDLPTLAGAVHEKEDFDLFDFMYRTFTTKNPHQDQLNILSKNWRRIYTTNYDDVIEFCHQKLGKTTDSYNYDDQKPSKINDSSIIHLHGVIKKATKKNINTQLILTESSYVRQHFEKSLWYDEFLRDIRFATNIFFIGYSLSDYHIASLLSKDDVQKQKIFFINGEVDKINSPKVSQYGTILPLSLNEFIDFYKNLPILNKSKNISSLKILKYIDPQKDKKTTTHPTPIEIKNLVMQGSFIESRCMHTLPESSYIINRSTSVTQATDELKKSKSLIIHSHLGNGKTIFLYTLAYKLSELGFKCFHCKDASSLLASEINAIKSIPNIIIIFDSYNIAIDSIEYLANELPSAKFILLTP